MTTTLEPNDSVSIENGTAADNSARNRLVINLLIVSAFVVILNETVMGVAIPRLMTDLGIAATSAQWLTTAFMLTMAVVIPITGFLLQRIHTRQVFITAMGLFAVGTTLAALSPGFEMLLVARVIQASGTAIMMPLLMTTIMTLEPPETRGRRMGSVSIVISVAPAIGPTISGLILEVASWRFLFVAMVPFAVAALALGMAKMRNVSEPRSMPIDPTSIVLSALGFGSLVFGLSKIGADGQNLPPEALLPILTGVAVIGLFVARQIILQRSDKALLYLRTLKTTTFTYCVLMFVVSMMAMFGAIILIPIYMQTVLGYSVLSAGLLLLPGGLLMGLLAPFVGRAYDKIGPRPLVIAGSVIASLSLFLLSGLGEGTDWYTLLGVHLVMSVGFALLFTPLFSASLGSLPPHLYSHGSAVLGTTQQVAGAMGTAVLIAVMSTIAADRGGLGASIASATADGIHTAFLVAAIVSLPAILIATQIRKPAAQPGMPVGH